MENAATVPEGIQPLFLAGQTCEIFQVRPGSDVTIEAPVKQIRKQDLLADISNRRAVSDFQPYKDRIEVSVRAK
jgi:hypothetical protein